MGIEAGLEGVFGQTNVLLDNTVGFNRCLVHHRFSQTLIFERAVGLVLLGAVARFCVIRLNPIRLGSSQDAFAMARYDVLHVGGARIAQLYSVPVEQMVVFVVFREVFVK